MDLQDEVDKKLGEVNTVQLQGPNSINTFQWNKDSYRWEEDHIGPSRRLFQTYQLRDLICDRPHTTRRKGSIMIVTMVDISKKIE